MARTRPRWCVSDLLYVFVCACVCPCALSSTFLSVPSLSQHHYFAQEWEAFFQLWADFAGLYRAEVSRLKAIQDQAAKEVLYDMFTVVSQWCPCILYRLSCAVGSAWCCCVLLRYSNTRKKSAPHNSLNRPRRRPRNRKTMQREPCARLETPR